MSLSCREAARLVSGGLDKKLPLADQATLQAHLLICRGCRSLSVRMAFLRRAVRSITERGD
jgi:predicted anti-sigma-YlaC factor YlaD